MENCKKKTETGNPDIDVLCSYDLSINSENPKIEVKTRT